MRSSPTQATGSQHCHSISTENYFLSPKMPIKDHINAFRSTQTSFKPNQTHNVLTA